jgi:hypothetical protein
MNPKVLEQFWLKSSQIWRATILTIGLSDWRVIELHTRRCKNLNSYFGDVLKFPTDLILKIVGGWGPNCVAVFNSTLSVPYL